MSYAEHGSRIFLTGNFNPNPLLRYGNYVARKRSEGRLKLFDSCSDLRAWSPHALDNCRHFRDIIEKRTPSGRIVPYDVLIEYLIVMGQTKLASVSRQLEKYKCLRLTPEQKKQLQELDYSSDVHVETSATSFSQESRIVEDESGIPKRPGTPTQSICSSSSNFQDIEIDNNSFTDDNSEDSQEAFVSSVTYFETTDLPHERSRQELTTGNRSSRTYDKNDHQKIIIKKDSEIISLNHELAAKEAELGETRDLCRNLKTALNEKMHTLENMKKNLKISQEQLVGMSDQVHDQIEEWKKKFYESKRLVDHLKATLAEKSQQCASYTQEIESLRAHLQATEKRNVEELRILLCQKNDLMELNKMQAINLADQEDEINRLLAYINQTQAKQNEQEMRMKSELQHLRSKIEAKNSVLSQLETHQVTVRTEISPTGSLSRVHTSEIIKLKKALQDDFRAIEDELSRREGRKDDYYQDEEVALWPKETRDRTKDEPAERENCQSHQALKECTIEQLPMQVSTTKMSGEGEIPTEEKICTDLENAKETIRRLVVELEPYVEERQTLHDEIKFLKESFDNVQREHRARDLKMQQQLSSEVENSRKRCEEDARKMAQLENLLKEKNRHGDNDDIDKEIDKVLAIHVKRSIQRMTKLSAGLKGAGDDIAKIRDEMDIRECEIAKLKDQVKFHVSRGQGDEANNENLKAIVKLKSEKKRLIDELKSNEESMKKFKDELQLRDFELKGLKQAKNKLSAQYKRDMQSIQKYIDSIKKEKDTLARENESLSTSVAMIGDLVNHSDSMKTKLDALQEENAKLTEDNTSMIKRCEDYENRLVDFANKEMQAKSGSDRAEFKLQRDSAKHEIELGKLREENERLMNESEAAKTKITKLTTELDRLRENEKSCNQMENVWVEISKLNQDKEILDDKVTRLRSTLESHRRTNDKLDYDLKWQISDNETWQLEINKLKDNIAIIANEKPLDAAEKNLLATLPNKMSENLEKLTKKLNAKQSFELIPWKEEIEKLRAKSLEDEDLIATLRDEIQTLKKKISEQEERTNALEVANANLSATLEAEKNSREYESQPTDLANEIRNKEHQIQRLTQDLEAKNAELRNLKEKIESLIKEKNDISNELKIEQEERGNSLKEVQQKHNARIKVLQASHEESMKNFIAQQDELMKSNGNAFDSESWLKSLTSREWAELHKRISALNPCETIVDPATKTRALNDKQNQELQLKEKLHTDTFNRKNEHQKESPIGLRYSYERRKFDNTKHKSVETSFDDNNLMTRKRKNFIQECAEKHKYDVGH